MVNLCVTSFAGSPHLSNGHDTKSEELKATMKESPRRYTNPFLSDEENDNFWSNPELESSFVEDDFTTNLEEDKCRKSLEPCNVPSESSEKAKELYVDKNVMECVLPELVACYEESGFHVVKDICVDEGLPHGKKILVDKEHHELFCNPITVNGDKHDDMIEDGLSTHFSKHERLRSSPFEDCYKNTDLCSLTKEKLDTGFPTQKPTNDHRSIGYNPVDMIGGNLDTQFLKRERMRSLSGEDCCINSELSFQTKGKPDTDLLIPEPTNGHRDMGKFDDTEISVQDGQNSPQRKDCKEEAGKECGTQAKVAIHSIPRELKNASEDDNGASNCAPDDLKLFIESNIVQNSVNCSPDNLMQTGEGKLDSSSNSLNYSSREQLVSGSIILLNQDQPLTSIEDFRESSNNGVNDVDQQLSQSPEEENLKKPLAGSEAEGPRRTNQTSNIPNESNMEEDITSNFGTMKPATIRGPCDAECVHEVTLETQSAPNHQDVASHNVTMANQLQHGEGESSFSVAGPVSGLITYSGPVASSGSVSLRSDSSTTSARSFAFPILQTEWNYSPVRMAKADHRHSKHRGWRKALLCCSF